MPLDAARKGQSRAYWSFEFAWARSALGRPLIGLSRWVDGCRRRRLRDAHAAAAYPGGPVSRAGPDLPRVAGMRRNASKSRNRRASASLTRPGVSAAALRQPPTRTLAEHLLAAGLGQLA